MPQRQYTARHPGRAARLLGATITLFLVACGLFAMHPQHRVGNTRYGQGTTDGQAAVTLGWTFIALAALPATLLMHNRKWAVRWGVMAAVLLFGAIYLMVSSARAH